MLMETSDHVPCVVNIATNIPKGKIFRLENYWMEHEVFMDVVRHGWSIPTQQSDVAKVISAKFKNLRRVLKAWQVQLSSLKGNIENVKLVLWLIQLVEFHRDLTIEEWNFKHILEDKLLSLLRQQRIYWKQRGTIKWVKFGDEGTKFFHANATLRSRRNLITTLHDNAGIPKSSHSEKVNILWEAFKDRLSTTEFQGMHLNLDDLLTASDLLGFLEEPFSHEEIDLVVQNLPTDKSPGLDGFNTDFIKKAWPIIKEDFYALCSAFYNGDICLQSINGSYITLIPKVDNASTASDFRPISLLNTSMKLITKLLANRLQSIIQSIIHKN